MADMTKDIDKEDTSSKTTVSAPAPKSVGVKRSSVEITQTPQELRGASVPSNSRPTGSASGAQPANPREGSLLKRHRTNRSRSVGDSTSISESHGSTAAIHVPSQRHLARELDTIREKSSSNSPLAQQRSNSPVGRVSSESIDRVVGEIQGDKQRSSSRSRPRKLPEAPERPPPPLMFDLTGEPSSASAENFSNGSNKSANNSSVPSEAQSQMVDETQTESPKDLIPDPATEPPVVPTLPAREAPRLIRKEGKVYPATQLEVATREKDETRKRIKALMVDSLERDSTMKLKNFFAPQTDLDSESEVEYAQDFSLGEALNLTEGAMKYVKKEFDKILMEFQNPRAVGEKFVPLFDFIQYTYASWRQLLRIVQLEVTREHEYSEGLIRRCNSLQEQLNNLKNQKIVYHEHIDSDLAPKPSTSSSASIEAAVAKQFGSYREALESKMDEVIKTKKSVFRKDIPDPSTKRAELPDQAIIIVHKGRMELETLCDPEAPMNTAARNLIAQKLEHVLDYNRYGFVIHNIFGTHQGFGISLPANQDLKTIASLIAESAQFGYQHKVEVKQRLMKLAVPGIKAALARQGPEHLVELIARQNLEPEARHLLRFGVLNRKANTLFLYMDQQLFDVLKNSEIYLSTFRYKVEIPHDYPLCYRCGGGGSPCQRM